MLLKIKTKSDKLITLETPDGKIVNIGYQKNAITLYKLSQLSIGAEVDLNVKTSDVSQGYSGNLYVDLGDAFLQSQLRVREFIVQEKTIANALKLLDA